jgi:proton-dependent oligopeptide transporter, POT family
MSKYRTAPQALTTNPKGIPYIVANEAAERFSFYGMKGILIIFMTKYLLDSDGNSAFMNEAEAKVWYHNFTSAVYFFPIIGALIADWFFGKYKTILALSVVYCLGHLSLAFMDLHLPYFEPKQFLLIGLMLIAIGSGGIKPCVSAHVGDQFGESNAHLLEKIFGWFYFSINLGAFASTLLTPWLLNNPDYGAAWAFGIPGVLMAIATIFFWMGRNVFIHIPAGGKEFIKETFSEEGVGSLGKLFVIYLFVAMFWALFDQTGSAWVLQAENMDRHFLGFEWLSSQIQAINPIMIMVFIPIFNYIIYPAINSVFKLTPLRKIGIGFFLTVPAFLLPAWIEAQIEAGQVINISWQLLAYVLITAAEVFVSITCLEFSYTQAPKKMKSFIMASFLLSVSLGNQFVSIFNIYIQNPSPEIEVNVEGEYIFALHASDGKLQTSKEITVSVLNTKNNIEPKKQKDTTSSETKEPTISFAKSEYTVQPNQQKNIFASIDFGDSDGTVRYNWKSPNATILDNNRRYTTFTAKEEGSYEVTLELNIGTTTVRHSVNVLVTNDNLPPVVNLTEESEFVLYKPCTGIKGLFSSTCTEKQMITFGSIGNTDSSYDPNGDEVTYEWELKKQPQGSSLTTEDIKGRNFAYATTKISGAVYYLFFALCMLITAIGFIPYAMFYKGKTYIQEEKKSDGIS